MFQLTFLSTSDGRNVAVQAEMVCLECSVRTSQDIPVAVRRAKYRDVRFSVSVVVPGNRNVFAEADLVA